MLFSEDFSRHHQRALVPIFDGAEQCHRGDDSFP